MPRVVRDSIHRKRTERATGQQVFISALLALDPKPIRQKPVRSNVEGLAMELADGPAAGIMFNAVLCTTTTTQQALVARSVTLLETPGSAPPVPCSTKHSGDDARRYKMTQRRHGAEESVRDDPRRLQEAPSLEFLTDTEMRMWCLRSL